MTARLFVYRIAGSAHWAVSIRRTARDWDHFGDYLTWREAFDAAWLHARKDRDRYRTWWPPARQAPRKLPPG